MAETDAPTVRLCEFVDQVRDEVEVLAQMRAEGTDGYRVGFRVRTVELEVKVVAQRGGDGKLALKVPMLEASVGGNLSESVTHSVRLVLDAFEQDPHSGVRRGDIDIDASTVER
jgi:hypothetical protein